MSRTTLNVVSGFHCMINILSHRTCRHARTHNATLTFKREIRERPWLKWLVEETWWSNWKGDSEWRPERTLSELKEFPSWFWFPSSGLEPQFSSIQSQLVLVQVLNRGPMSNNIRIQLIITIVLNNVCAVKLNTWLQPLDYVLKSNLNIITHPL